MAADVLLANVSTDTASQEVSLRVVGSQIPPAKMTLQVSISGSAKVQIQGRVHRKAPWADIGAPIENSCLFYIDPIADLRAVSKEVQANSTVSVWAAWGV
jgi:hypothetical protein